ncbi:hypothetical protein WJX79_004474 [Trebouxia sp. C0005]
MEVDEAHRLYQQFQKVDAAAKQKQGLGFGAASPPRPDTEVSKPSNGWEAPYKLSDKYQQPDTKSRKRSRSPSHHKSYRSRPASRSPPSPSRGNSTSHKAKRSRRSGSREPERHHQTHSMGPTERLKAVTQYKLRKTSSKEPNDADGKPWTRFVFNNEALLDEEGAVPEGPGFEGSGQAALGAFDFRQHRSVQPALPAEDAHEAAIFGAPAAQVPAGDDPLRRPASAASSDSDERPQVVELHEITAFGDDADPSDAAEPGAASPPKLSWRERALLKKQQAEGS